MNLSKDELNTILDSMEERISAINEALEDPIYTEEEKAELRANKSATLTLAMRVMHERTKGEQP